MPGTALLSWLLLSGQDTYREGGWVHKRSGALSTRAGSHSARREGLWPCGEATIHGKLSEFRRSHSVSQASGFRKLVACGGPTIHGELSEFRKPHSVAFPVGLRFPLSLHVLAAVPRHPVEHRFTTLVPRERSADGPA